MTDFKTIEQEARAVWARQSATLAKAVEDDPSKPLFSFLEGPPTANAPPAIHHLEVRTFKDAICKYKYMRGLSVPRKGGWDTHGLPVEVQVEKALGLKSKKEVLEYGMEKFIEQCRNSVFSNIKDWESSTEELHYQVDLKNPYITLDNNYIESVWWSLKELYNKGLLYEGFKVVPFCTRCGTPLSSHEVSQGYKDVQDDSVYVLFKVKEGEYLLAWTTTPWTLPGNVGLAVGEEIDYVRVQLPNGDKVIVAKERQEVLGEGNLVLEEFKGKKLIGTKYRPLFDIKALQNEKSHKVIAAGFVTTTDGTGIVHTAGMYGEDDYEVCKQQGIPLTHTVNQEGKFNELVPLFEGKFVKSAEKEIIKHLQENGNLFKMQKYTHAYPFCWRCSSPLIYYAITSWFIATTKVKQRMQELNEEISWSPKHIRDGRFGIWLENIKDWSLSRFKFWGTPLPVWRCSRGKEKIIGSVKELQEHAKQKFTEYDLHRPWVDGITLNCTCGKEMTRISDVIDVWYDSGAASFAQFHYPFENKELFNRRFPYDYIAEAIDQTRGWFYTLHAISTMLFDKPAYKNVICAGHVVDDNGEKMSKSKGNVIKPSEIIPKIGVDAVRLQFCRTEAGSQKRFSEKLVRDNILPFLTVLTNCKKFYEQAEDNPANEHIEDRWILSRLNSTILQVTQHLEEYDLDKALECIFTFTVQDFSRTYIKITRDRDDTKATLGEVLQKIALILAPFAPYISEYLHQSFKEKSVHLSSWPIVDSDKIDGQLEATMETVFKIIEAGLLARDKAHVGLKWPLAKATVNAKLESALPQEEEAIVLAQLNVKKIAYTFENEEENIVVVLDTTITPELESEGYLREITRKIQALRKTAGLVKTTPILLHVNKEYQPIIESQEAFVKEKVSAKEILYTEEKLDVSDEGKIKEKVYSISLRILS